MKILSVHVGKPQKYTLNDITIETSMVKSSQAQIQVNKESIDGDSFQMKNIHGTVDSVLYALDYRHYEYWSRFLGRPTPAGTLGENLSVSGLNENELFLGDEFQCGGVVMKVTGVRYPCNRLNYVTGNSKMQHAFRDQNWPGVYFETVQPGIIRPQDDLVLEKRLQSDISVLDLYVALRHAEKGSLSEPMFDKLADNPFVLHRYKKNLYRSMGKQLR